MAGGRGCGARRVRALAEGPARRGDVAGAGSSPWGRRVPAAGPPWSRRRLAAAALRSGGVQLLGLGAGAYIY